MIGSSEISNLDDVFDVLSSAYSKDPITSLATICQEHDETIREYVVRFKIGVNNMKRNSNAVPDKQILLYFVNGLLAKYRKSFDVLKAKSFDDAVERVLLEEDYEQHQKGHEILNVISSPSLSNSKSTSKSIDSNRNMELINKKMDKVVNKLNLIQEKQVPMQTNSYRNNNKPIMYSSPSYGNKNVTLNNNFKNRICFGCNKSGHIFRDCRSTPEHKKREISKNFQQYLAQFNENHLNSVSVSSCPPVMHKKVQEDKNQQ